MAATSEQGTGGTRQAVLSDGGLVLFRVAGVPVLLAPSWWVGSLIVVVLCLVMAWATTQSLPVAALARLPALGITGATFHAAIATFAVLTAAFMLVKLVQLWQDAPPDTEVG